MKVVSEELLAKESDEHLATKHTDSHVKIVLKDSPRQHLKEEMRVDKESITNPTITPNLLNQDRIQLSTSEASAADPLPDHLRERISKAKGDAQIKEFVKLTCDLCANNQAHRSFKDLLDHFQSKHGQRGYALCCEKKFYRKDRLMNHITNHINPEAFK